MTLPVTTYKSDRRCPRTTCDYHGHLLDLDVGQNETTGVLEVRHHCPCGYAERGPATVAVARKTSTTVAELLYRIRRDGVEVPMRIDPSPFPESEFDQEEVDA